MPNQHRKKREGGKHDHFTSTTTVFALILVVVTAAGTPSSAVPTSTRLHGGRAVRKSQRLSGLYRNRASCRSSSRIRKDGTETNKFASRQFELTDPLKLEFLRDGHITTRSLFSRSEISDLRELILAEYNERLLEAYRHRCEIALGSESAKRLKTVSDGEKLLKSRFVEVPFMQVFNTWRNTKRKPLRDFLMSPRLARMAGDLLGCKRVCLYQDSLFVKRPGDGPTHWHSDLNLTPLDTNNFVTIWIPLTDIPEAGSGLQYASSSHRDFSLNHWWNAQQRENMDLSDRYQVKDYGEMSLGDAAWHHGWCLHMASGISEGASTSSISCDPSWRGRAALAISYFSGDGDARVLPRKLRKRIDDEDRLSYSDWVNRIHDGVPIRGQHRNLPCIFDASDEERFSPENDFSGEDVAL